MTHLFFFTDPATTEIYTLSLHDALPISAIKIGVEETPWFDLEPLLFSMAAEQTVGAQAKGLIRSEEHTSELQSHSDLVCRLLLEKKKKDRATTRVQLGTAEPRSSDMTQN